MKLLNGIDLSKSGLLNPGRYEMVVDRSQFYAKNPDAVGDEKKWAEVDDYNAWNRLPNDNAKRVTYTLVVSGANPDNMGRTIRSDFYMGENALTMLNGFFESCSCTSYKGGPNATDLDEPIGKTVLVDLLLNEAGTKTGKDGASFETPAQNKVKKFVKV